MFSYQTGNLFVKEIFHLGALYNAVVILIFLPPYRTALRRKLSKHAGSDSRGSAWT